MHHLTAGNTPLIGHSYQGHIQFPGVQASEILFARTNDDIHQHGGIGSGKFCQNFRQNPGTHIVRRANTHFPLKGWRNEILHGLFIQAQQSAPIIKKNLPFCGQRDTPGFANKQGFPEVPLKLFDLHAQGGRCSVNGFGGTGKRAMFRNGNETPEHIVIKQRHVHGRTLRIDLWPATALSITEQDLKFFSFD